MSSALKQAKSLASYNNKLERSNVKLQYQYNKALAEQDRSFQERMANSAHQREIADLKKSGLNPVLSVTGGNGASTPTGSSASVSKPDVDMSLPKAVMDMAQAQLNSATALQTTAMNNANALHQIYEQGYQTRLNQANQYGYDLGVKQSFSGDSPLGQIYNLPDTINSTYDNTIKEGKNLWDKISSSKLVTSAREKFRQSNTIKRFNKARATNIVFNDKSNRPKIKRLAKSYKKMSFRERRALSKSDRKMYRRAVRTARRWS